MIAFLTRFVSSAVAMAVGRGLALDGWQMQRRLDVIYFDQRALETLAYAGSRAHGLN